MQKCKLVRGVLVWDVLFGSVETYREKERLKVREKKVLEK
jgi:hypothetical protein